ncbi:MULTISPECIES: isochorismatase family cysteine hydrolase [unclassified Paenibacillus]|uniref:cysteine hydrolase family protein n=1 Tax=unclassified Paenibacillus TaxID=185978 RepID=UPI001AE4AC30|nr:MULTISPECIES: isochorismatase family cysteine hydrolase [unclassified Paenibacillus]MBP1154152.1 ureidoacrylate peracid hydrolase [Paenibacillus sp. PvP091]MBP1170463.1 ureidoacrylate peracid hydrolase [Paenibacillus sp. PvR098]MBP2441491.1 ureidoacrylate peracid hydrolase [Paenibacillus sp. PvP052]
MQDIFLNPEHTAFMIIDVQNDFCHEDGAQAKLGNDVTGAQKAVPVMEDLMAEARLRGIPIIYVYTTHSDTSSSKAWVNRPNGRSRLSVVREGTWGAEYYRVSPQEGDIVVEKHRYSAFIRTALEEKLRQLGIKSLILTGVATNVCVESTARHGFMLDFNITMVRDGCAAYATELEEATYRNIQTNFGLVLDSKDIKEYWSNLQQAVKR